MRYRKPFDLAQRQKAIASFRSFRHNYRVLKRLYAPANPAEVALLRSYRRLIGRFRDELIQPDRAVSADKLDALEIKLSTAFIQYMAQKMRLPEDS